MFRLLFIGFSVLLSSKVFTQTIGSVGARSASMANASVAISDSWSYYTNPGALADIRKFAVGISYENRFLLKELQTQGLVSIQPIKVGVLSFGTQFSGLDIFRTSKLGMGYSLKLSDYLFVGVQLNYQTFRFLSNYGKQSCVTAETGIYMKLSKDWRIGVSIFNLGRTFLSRSLDERVSTVMRLGSKYSFSSHLFVLMEAEKNINYPLRLKTGIEYQPNEKFMIRGGVATKPIEITFGLGYKFSCFQLDLGSAYYQLIGWSPHCSLTYKLDN